MVSGGEKNLKNTAQVTNNFGDLDTPTQEFNDSHKFGALNYDAAGNSEGSSGNQRMTKELWTLM